MPCSYDPTELAGLPMGMLHCPECDEVVLAGVPHPDYEAFWADVAAGKIDLTAPPPVDDEDEGLPF